MFLNDPRAVGVGALDDSTTNGDLVDDPRGDVSRKNTAEEALVTYPVDNAPTDNPLEDVPG